MDIQVHVEVDGKNLVFAMTIKLFPEFWRNKERGCRLEIIMDQDPCKSDLEPIF